jgi:hypothetical protein
VGCATLQATVDVTQTGGTANLGSCVYTSGATVARSMTLVGGTIRQGGTALTITGNDVTVDTVAFDGGNNTIRVSGDRARILRTTFVNMRESSIRLNPGADDTLVEANTITQTIQVGSGYSPVACNDGGAGVGTFNGATFRDNVIDQGGTNVSHFGIECWGVANLVIEGNTLRGQDALVSIPRSDGAIVRNNTFGGGYFWGIELADVSGAQVLDNIVTGNGATGDGRAFVQLHPGSGTVTDIRIQRNRVTNQWALVNAAGSGHTIADNCGGWTKLFAYSFSGPVTLTGNGPC